MLIVICNTMYPITGHIKSGYSSYLKCYKYYNVILLGITFSSNYNY